MKKISLIAIFMLTIAIARAQDNGIRFLTNTKWEDALALAKSQNKLIFVDVFTDWCAPCKSMDLEVFTQQTVAAKYNSAFINYKLDAEKGEGPALKKRYEVKSYPNLLFVNGNGDLVFRSIGALEARELLLLADQALAEAKQPQTIVQLEALYPTRSKDKAFMYAYVSRKTQLNLGNADLLDEYIGLLTEAERGERKNLQLIFDNGGYFNQSLQLGIALETLTKHQDQFDQLERKHAESLEMIVSQAKETSLAKAIRYKDEALFKKVLDLSPTFDRNFANNKLSTQLAYYLGTRQNQASLATAKAYLERLMAIPADSLKKWDSRTYESNKALLAKGDAQTLEQYRHAQTISLLKLVDGTAQHIASLSQAREDLELAKRSSEFTLKIAQTDEAYYQNVMPVFMQHHCVILYKLGEKALAISRLEGFITKLNHPKAAEYFAPLLNKMKANEKL